MDHALLNDTARTSSRPLIRRLLVFGICLTVLLVSIGILASLASHPWPGFIVSPDLTILRVIDGGPASNTDVKPGDVIVSIDGHPIRSFAELMAVAGQKELVGRTVPVLLLRNGRDHPINIDFVRYSLEAKALVNAAIGIILFLFGAYVYNRLPESGPATAYFFMETALAAILITTTHWIRLIPTLSLILFWLLLLPLAPALTLHFFLIFPRAKRFMEGQRPWLPSLLYIPAAAFIVVCSALICRAGLDFLHGTFAPMVYDCIAWSAIGFFVYVLVYLGLGFAGIWHSYTKGMAVERIQMKLIVIGTMVTLVMAVWTFPFIIAILKRPTIMIGMSSFLWVGFYPLSVILIIFLPFSLAASILKYRLMDIDTAINRSLLYIAVSFVLFVLYLAIFGFIGWLFGRVTTTVSHLSIIIFTLIVALGFHPLRNVLARIVERLLYRDRFVYRSALRDLSDAVVSILDIEEILGKIVQTVMETLRVKDCTILLRKGEESDYCAVATAGGEGVEHGLILRANSSLVRTLIRRKKWIHMLDLEGEVALSDGLEQARAGMKRLRARVAAPLLFHGDLIGLMVLGEKGSRDIYTREEMEVLDTLTNHAAIAIRNATAFNTIEGLNTELNAKIKRIEEQQGQILRLQEKLIDENRYLREEIEEKYDFAEIIGSSSHLAELLGMVKKVSRTPSAVLISGESGTGKELIARAIHYNSDRSDGPFIKVNSAAIQESLIESELFGHEKGAFTGAIRQRKGRFELADKGTLFLDEIGELPHPLQAKLLRTLQEMEFERVGGSDTIKVDVRIISSTNRDLSSAIADGDFREDLFYRLNVFSLIVPPLRDRVEDIPELILHFINHFNRKHKKSVKNIDEGAMDALRKYRWPGNVRELENVIERALVVMEEDILGIDDLPFEVKSAIDQPGDLPASGRGDESPVPAGPDLSPLRDEIKQMEKDRIVGALREAGGNKSLAARMLGLKRTTFLNKLKKFEVF
ncbi:sigma 54-interacting transcriptional regulator [Thermodesulfobacteriota bacterium]